MKGKHWMRLAIALLVVAAVALIIRDTARLRGLEPQLYRIVPKAIMGTQTELSVVAPASREDLAVKALAAAEAALRNVEARMSRYLESSPVSRLNAAPAGEIVPLPAEVLELLRTSRQFAEQTDGAFDVTCLPLLEVWKQAGQDQRLPGDQELTAAIGRVGWTHFELLDDGARKNIDEAAVDLGGIAKGYGIDRAVEAIQAAGLGSGVVNVGGDVRCFGIRPDGRAWRLAVRNPFDDSMLATLAVRDAAVCTSGDYRRHVEIDGKRYSHIVDPRTGRPAAIAPSVTVIAPTAAIADPWATALSVLGPEGFGRIPPDSGVEAMIVVGGPEDYQVRKTKGFDRYVTEP